MSSFLSTIEEIAPDPLFVLNDLYAKDTNPNKINLGIGIFKNEEGKTPFMNVFLNEVEALVGEARSFTLGAEYLPIQGHPLYLKTTKELVLSPSSNALKENRVGALQTPGGTAALYLGAELLGEKLKFSKVYMSNPTWVNHFNIFERAGCSIHQYPYRNPETNLFDLDAMIACIKKAPKNSVFLLHAACHNPTGIDPTESDWKEILKALETQECIPFFDSAYQGLGKSLDEDAFAIRLADSMGLEFFISVSFSKNLSLYRQRLGALLLIGKDSKGVNNGIEYLKSKVIRATWSNPPAIGASCASRILSDEKKRSAWLVELNQLRDRIRGLREDFVSQLESKGIPSRALASQLGMFSFTGLTEPQVLKLREKFGIYMTNDSRVNLAGLSQKTLPYVTDAIVSVVKG